MEQYKLVRGPRREDDRPGPGERRQAEAALRGPGQLSYAKVYSPLDGIVLSKNIEPGEYVAPGTPVVTVADLENIWLRAYIDETDLEPGEGAARRPRSPPTLSRQGLRGPRLLHLPEAEFTPKTVQTEKERVKLVYRIKIDIQNPDMELKPGMPADATIKEGKGRGLKASGLNRQAAKFNPAILSSSS